MVPATWLDRIYEIAVGAAFQEWIVPILRLVRITPMAYAARPQT